MPERNPYTRKGHISNRFVQSDLEGVGPNEVASEFLFSAFRCRSLGTELTPPRRSKDGRGRPISGRGDGWRLRRSSCEMRVC
jgi:hypothetical protein